MNKHRIPPSFLLITSAFFLTLVVATGFAFTRPKGALRVDVETLAKQIEQKGE